MPTNNQCSCGSCPGKGCTYGCQSTQTKTNACQCGDACKCGPNCACQKK